MYKKDVELRSGKVQTIYFFSKRKPKSGTPSPLPDGYEVKKPKSGKRCVLPDGYKVAINKRSGMPYLKRSNK
ncbi:hypothetical protein B6U70_00610 [Euryarchaeota archaeon ex4484_162]|nr:MAG: hypothetical protein B6U70_00610 [Euryarchaeota archaeon ex4484_162]